MDNLSSRISQIEPSVTLKITAEAKKLIKQGKDVINFAAGEPDFDTPNYIKKEAIKAIKQGFTKYTPSTGTLELKEAICKHLLNSKNIKYSPENIVVNCGAKHSLYNILQAICSSGDEVIIQSPYWVSYPEMIKLAEATPKIIPTSIDNNFKLTPDQLSQSLNDKVKAFILNSPSNPTGSVYTESELRDIISVLKSRNIYIVSDEIYDELVYDVKALSIASLDEELKEKVILVGGVSKTYAMTGWRIGYLAAPLNVAQAIGSLQSHSTSNPCSISQKAALAALSKGNEAIKSMVVKLKKRRDFMYSMLSDIANIKPVFPEGSFYIFCDISKITNDSLGFAKDLLEDKNVAVIPGVAFGCEGFIRLSFATSRKEIEEGIIRIEDSLS